MEKGKKTLTKIENATAEQRKRYARRKRGAEKAIAESVKDDTFKIENVGLLSDGTGAIVLANENESVTIEIYNLYPLIEFNGTAEELKNMSAETRKELTPKFRGIMSDFEDTHTKIFELLEYLCKYIGKTVTIEIVECKNVLRYYDGKYYTKSEDFYIVLNEIKAKKGKNA